MSEDPQDKFELIRGVLDHNIGPAWDALIDIEEQLEAAEKDSERRTDLLNEAIDRAEQAEEQLEALRQALVEIELASHRSSAESARLAAREVATRALDALESNPASKPYATTHKGSTAAADRERELWGDSNQDDAPASTPKDEKGGS